VINLKSKVNQSVSGPPTDLLSKRWLEGSVNAMSNVPYEFNTGGIFETFDQTSSVHWSNEFLLLIHPSSRIISCLYIIYFNN